MYLEILEARFRFSFRIMRSKIVPEFGDECGVVSKPRCITAGGECGFKPVKRSSVEKGQYVSYLSTVVRECVGTVAEVQEALGQEQLEFTGVRSVELIQFPDSGLN